MASQRGEVTNERRNSDELAAPSAPGGEAGRRLAFGPFVLDPASGRLSEGERVIPLAPRPFETLLYLARNPGRVVSKTELMERLWPDTFVTDDVLVQCVVEIRKALGDQARTPQYVQTVPRRGYEFLAPVRALEAGSRAEVVAPPAEPSVPSGGPPRPGLPGSRRTVVWAAAAAGAALAALVAYRVYTAAPSFEVDPGSLVVMPVIVDEPTPQSGWLQHGLAEMIRSQLGQTPGIRVVARHRLAAALAEAGYDEDKGLAPEAALQIARKLRAERLVTGSFVRAEERFVVSAQVVNVPSGRSEGNEVVRGRHPAGLLEAVDELCLKLLHDLRPAGMQGAAWRPTRLATQSIDAYREYSEALLSFARGGRAGGELAEKRLDEALRLDPSFAQAYVKKAEVQQWRREWGYGDPDPAPAVRAAARLVKELPDRERLLVESFEALILRGQPDEALKNWNALLQFYPTYAQEIGIPGLVANTFLRQGRWDELILVGEAHVDSPSLPDADRARLSSLLGQAFRRKGDFARAVECARRAVRLWPQGGPGILDQRCLLGRWALEAGRREEALLEFRAVARAPEADHHTLTDAAWGLYMADARDEAATCVERALELNPVYGNAYHLRGWLRLAAGDLALAASDLDTAFERTPRAFGHPYQGNVNGDLAALYYSGVAYLKLGQKERGASTLRRLIEHCSGLLEHGRPQGGASEWQAASFRARAAARLGQAAPEPGPLAGDDTTYFVQSARLHAVQRKREQALKELLQGLALGHGEHRHIADDPDFESLRSTPEFQRAVMEHLRH